MPPRSPVIPRGPRNPSYPTDNHGFLAPLGMTADSSGHPDLAGAHRPLPTASYSPGYAPANFTYSAYAAFWFSRPNRSVISSQVVAHPVSDSCGSAPAIAPVTA